MSLDASSLLLNLSAGTYLLSLCMNFVNYHLYPVKVLSAVLISALFYWCYGLNLNYSCIPNSIDYLFHRRFETSPHLSKCDKAVVVNVSSLAAVQGFPTWSLYCAGKAAREIYHNVLAQEQSIKFHAATAAAAGSASADAAALGSVKEVTVLNYAPGPQDTQMQIDVRAAEANDPSLGTIYTDLKKQNLLVDSAVSAGKLVKLLNTPGSFKSGAHVDYYDI